MARTDVNLVWTKPLSSAALAIENPVGFPQSLEFLFPPCHALLIAYVNRHANRIKIGAILCGLVQLLTCRCLVLLQLASLELGLVLGKLCLKLQFMFRIGRRLGFVYKFRMLTCRLRLSSFRLCSKAREVGLDNFEDPNNAFVCVLHAIVLTHFRDL